MIVNIGDKVRFLNDVGEGIVTKIVNKKIVNVLIEDGFELPTQIEELIVVESFVAQKKTSEEQNIVKSVFQQTQQPKAEPKVIIEEEIEEFEGNDAPIVFFAFAPENPDDILASKINLHLINDCNYILMYVISTNTADKYKYFAHGTINPNTKVLLNSIQFEQLNKIECFLFNFVFYKKGDFDPVKPLETKLKLNPIKFTKEGCFETNDFLEEKSLIYCVTQNIEDNLKTLNHKDIKEIIQEKNISEVEQKNLGERYKARPEPITVEVDLHINNLLVDCRGMTNQEILDFQMKHFHSQMSKAISSNAGRIIFIHGIGNGTLKNEVRKSLTENYSKFKYQDASFKEYGFGATLVILK